MKTFGMGTLCAFVLASAAGCTSNYDKAEAATKDMIAGFDEVAAALEGVQDNETAKAAAPKIEAAIDRIQQSKTKLDGLTGTKAENDRLEKEYMPKMEAAGARIKNAVPMAVIKSQGEPSLQRALEKFGTLK